MVPVEQCPQSLRDPIGTDAMPAFSALMAPSAQLLVLVLVLPGVLAGRQSSPPTSSMPLPAELADRSYAFYVVKPGDTYGHIAAKLGLRSAATLTAVEGNPPERELPVGETIRVPLRERGPG